MILICPCCNTSANKRDKNNLYCNCRALEVIDYTDLYFYFKYYEYFYSYMLNVWGQFSVDKNHNLHYNNDNLLDTSYITDNSQSVQESLFAIKKDIDRYKNLQTFL